MTLASPRPAPAWKTPAEAAGQTVLIADEQEAALALQGLEGDRASRIGPDPALRGPRDPEGLLAHMDYDGSAPASAKRSKQRFRPRQPRGHADRRQQSLCYQLRAGLTVAHDRGQPLIALMADQVKRLRSEATPAVMFRLRSR